MKEINEDFALKIIEKQIGRPAQEIKAQGTYESELWPAGLGEYSASITGYIRTAKTVVEYFKQQRPLKITVGDINKIVSIRKGQEKFPYKVENLAHWVEKINIIFDIYEE